jgi:carbamoyltransferase
MNTGLLLGYCSLNHDPAVAVVENGAVLCAIESEKVTRHKHEISVLPEQAIRFALDAAGRRWEDVDAIVTNHDAGPASNLGYAPLLWSAITSRSFDFSGIVNALVIHASHNRRLFRRLPERDIPPIVRVRHHLAHVAGAFLYSPFDSAAVVVIDACGELECTSAYYCHDRSIRALYSMNLPSDSLGFVYMMATQHLGYDMLGDEYKVMGLAPFGEPRRAFQQFFEDLIQLLPKGRYRISPHLFGKLHLTGWKFPPDVERRLGFRRRRGEELRQEHKDFAYALQRRTEEAILHVVRHVRKIAPARHLCLSGGVALNSVANGRLLAEGLYDEIYVPPAPHDAGTSLGAAAFHHFYTLGGERPAPLRHASLARTYDDQTIEQDLVRCGLPFGRCPDPARTAAQLLVAGHVIGWFQGATEFGPRALGNRSILADPRLVDIRDRVNRKVKERESYRPFAPSILASEAGRFFEHVRSSPFMSFVDRVRPERRSELSAVVHIDGTSRPQTVTAAENPLFFELISHFKTLTGVPAVLNTSFNVAGEPIVNTPADAIRCFFASGLDALVMGRFVLHKAVHPAPFPASDARRRDAAGAVTATAP